MFLYVLKWLCLLSLAFYFAFPDLALLNSFAVIALLFIKRKLIEQSAGELITFSAMSQPFLFTARLNRTGIRPEGLRYIDTAFAIHMFISGLLNVLSLMPYVLLFAGLALLFIHIRAVYRKEEAPVYRQPGYLIFLLLCLFSIFILKGQYYIQYDDFSHWGTVLKEMFYYNTFPDSRSIITFRNYPPGTASFLYFVCKIIGYNESYALMAQAFLCAATFPALFCGCKKIFEAKTFLLIFAGILTFFLMIYDDGSLHIQSLLVDALLGFVFSAVLIMMDYYKDDLEKSTVFSSIILLFLLLIKDSAKIFVVMGIVFLFLVNQDKRKFTIKEKFTEILKILLPAIVMCILWSKYVVKAYPAFSFYDNKFSFTLSSLFGSSTSEKFKLIFPPFLKCVFNIHNANMLALILINAFCIIYSIVIIRKQGSYLLKRVIVLNGFNVFYLFMLLLMYVCIMPKNEAVHIPAFARYYGTFIIVMIMSLLYFTINTIKLQSPGSLLCSAGVLALVLWFLLPQIITAVRMPKCDIRRVGLVDYVQNCGHINRGGSYLIRCKDEFNGYTFWAAGYEFLTTKCKIISDETTDLSEFADYDYFLDLSPEKGLANESRVNIQMISHGKYYAAYKRIE